jgi:hypothetical protein
MPACRNFPDSICDRPQTGISIKAKQLAVSSFVRRPSKKKWKLCLTLDRASIYLDSWSVTESGCVIYLKRDEAEFLGTSTPNKPIVPVPKKICLC